MKNIILFSLLVFANINLFSQSEEDALLETFEEYSTHVTNKAHTKLVEYLHPAMFEIASKESVAQMMDEAYADTATFMTIRDMNVDSLSDIMADQTNQYCLIYHNFTLIMKMLPKNGSGFALRESQENAVHTYNWIKEAYGSENVKLDKENASCEILMKSQTFAINDTQTDGWKFIEAKKDSHAILKTILPQSVFSIVE